MAYALRVYIQTKKKKKSWGVQYYLPNFNTLYFVTQV